MKLARAKGKPKTSDAGGDSRFISPHHRRRMEIRRLVAKAPITVRPSLMHLLAHVELATEESARPGAGRIIALERQNEELKERVRESEERCETLKELCGIAEERQRRQEAKTEKLLARVAALEARPVDQHIKGLEAMGAVITVAHGYIEASLPPGQSRLKGAHITTDMVTVTGTENFLMAASLADGETVLENAAQEPEITDLAEMLIGMGADIVGHGTRRIRIRGVAELTGCTHTVVADRIEAGTFLCAVAAAGGDVFLRHAQAAHLDAVIDKLREAGVSVQPESDGLRVRSAGALALKAQSFRTTEYPGFPTDMQAQFMC